MRYSHLYKCWFLLLIVIFMINNLHAQKPQNYPSLQIIPDETEESFVQNNMRLNKITGVPLALYKPNYSVRRDSPEKMARQYLSDNYRLFRISADLSDLKYLNTTETPGGYHVRFLQYKGDYPVFNARINVTISRDNRVVFVTNGFKSGYETKEEANLKTINVTKEQALISAKEYLGIKGAIAFEKSETAVYYNKGTFRLAQIVTIVPSEELIGEWQIMIDAQSGELFRVEDVACYSKPLSNPLLVDGTGYVFDPDPITHARTTYGSTGFVDNNDADSDSLTAHRELRTLKDITFDGSVYTLKGPWAEIRDFESPYTGLHTNSTSNFLFTRFNDNFEAVNVYFHIDNSMRWVNNSLGFTLTPYQYVGGVRFDPHGLSGSDNSHYITSTGSIAYGDGGVDDAEDLGVVLHELCHGIHDWITAGGLSQVEGLSEGSCDYWATSYIRSTGYWTPAYPAYNWVFIWDGHNPFWAGRITNYTAHYPEGLTGTIHTDGQMWSSSLMSIYDLIGKIPTDKNFLEALSMTDGSSGQQDAANAFIAADQLLYGGGHLTQIIPVFADRGYIEGPIAADFMADVTNGQAPLTVHFTDLSISQPNPIISWQWDFNNDGITDATSQNPTWIYSDFGIFSVKLTVSDGTNVDTETKIDYITVTDPNQVTDTLFIDKFEAGLGNWTITNNGGTCVWEIITPPYPNAYTLPAASSGGLLAADSDECGSGTTMNTTATINQILDFSIYDVVTIEFDNDWNIYDAQDEAHVEVSTNGGSTWVGVWDQIGTDIRNTHETINISSLAAGKSNVKIRVRSVQPGWDWWWVIDNFNVYGTYVQPSNTFQFSVNINNGWNMVSIPGLHPVDQNVSTWWEFRDFATNVFGYNNGYYTVNTAEPTEGYWMKHTGTRTYNTGDEWPASGIIKVPHDTLQNINGWKMLGVYECPVAVVDIQTIPPNCLNLPVYGYNNGYQIVDTLYPGYGYYVKGSCSAVIFPPCKFA
ncbi:MAG: PKD domain-containing protein [bacterium]|nr:PKD domain-containing protein [bacterium]